MRREITVIKRNFMGEFVWEYSGKILRSTSNMMVIEARFNHNDIMVGGLLLSKGDIFIEWYQKAMWGNIFQVHDGNNGQLKGWYCNITYPPIFDEATITYMDLALDLVVLPDRTQILLDEQEYQALNLSESDQACVAEALEKLRTLFKLNRDLDLRKI
jgi:protein associated with RNAse G/E